METMTLKDVKDLGPEGHPEITRRYRKVFPNGTEDHISCQAATLEIYLLLGQSVYCNLSSQKPLPDYTPWANELDEETYEYWDYNMDIMRDLGRTTNIVDGDTFDMIDIHDKIISRFYSTTRTNRISGHRYNVIIYNQYIRNLFGHIFSFNSEEFQTFKGNLELYYDDSDGEIMEHRLIPPAYRQISFNGRARIHQIYQQLLTDMEYSTSLRLHEYIKIWRNSDIANNGVSSIELRMSPLPFNAAGGYISSAMAQSQIQEMNQRRRQQEEQQRERQLRRDRQRQERQRQERQRQERQIQEQQRGLAEDNGRCHHTEDGVPIDSISFDPLDMEYGVIVRFYSPSARKGYCFNFGTLAGHWGSLMESRQFRVTQSDVNGTVLVGTSLVNIPEPVFQNMYLLPSNAIKVLQNITGAGKTTYYLSKTKTIIREINNNARNVPLYMLTPV